MSTAIDVDLQAVVVDTHGRIIDAAYYNNMKACGGKAIVHTGDEGRDAHDQGQEKVRLTLPLMPETVHMVLFLVCSFNGSPLQDVPRAELTFELARPEKRTISEAGINVAASGLLAAALVRQQGSPSWQLRPVGVALPGARHFMDCLQELNLVIVQEIPTANRRQKVAFAMEKGQNLDLGASHEEIVLGLGWDVSRGEVDLDAAAVLFNSEGQVLESVFFGNLSSNGEHSLPGAVRHSGDNLTGEGDGDDEQITVDLCRLGEAVTELFFCIHIYSKSESGQPKTFKDVANPYCRVVENSSGEELCRYTLAEAGSCSGLVIARLRRGPDGRFGFNALGLPSKGTMYKDSFEDMRKISRVQPRQLQQMGSGIFR